MMTTTPANPHIIPAIRAALPLLAEDPPISIGRSALASLVLPDSLDLRARAEALSSALTDAIDQLAPRPAVPKDDRRWWPHRIYLGEYIDCQRRSELEGRIAISRASYTRAKRAGLDRIIDLLPYLLADRVPAHTREVTQ